MKLTTIRPDGRVEALLIVHSFCVLILLGHGGKAIRRVSGAHPAPDTVAVDWIKLASFVTRKGDTDGYMRLMWLWCLGLAWLELQVF